MKYTIDFSPKHAGYVVAAGKFYAEGYVIEEKTSNEFFITIHCSDLIEGEMRDFSVQFHDWQHLAIVPQAYNKDLFDAIETEALKFITEMFNGMANHG